MYDNFDTVEFHILSMWHPRKTIHEAQATIIQFNMGLQTLRVGVKLFLLLAFHPLSDTSSFPNHQVPSLEYPSPQTIGFENIPAATRHLIKLRRTVAAVSEPPYLKGVRYFHV